jgi:biotin operon repressor
MSSEWVKAGKYFAGYSESVYSASGKSRKKKRDKLPNLEARSTPKVSDVITRATMRELCLISHDAGLVMVSHTELARRLGVSYHAIKRAIKRLTDDGYLVLVRRGSGSPLELNKAHYANARVNAYLLARLPDEHGYKLPTPEYLERAFFKLVKSARYQGLKEEQRQELARTVAELYEFQ